MSDVHDLTPDELAAMRRRALGFEPAMVRVVDDELVVDWSDTEDRPRAVVWSAEEIDTLVDVIRRHRLALAVARTRLDNQQARIGALEDRVTALENPLPPP